jgi:ATP-binding cassette subfamily B protein
MQANAEEMILERNGKVFKLWVNEDAKEDEDIIIFFDEATNSLDSNNEKIIMENLHEFYKGKTVVVVAHRLSTVKDADKIIVLDKGKVIEEGTHAELTQKRGAYYTLVKNQLELGQ